MTKAIVLTILTVLLECSVSQAQPEIDFLRYYDFQHRDLDGFQDIYGCANGKYFVCGSSGGQPWLACLDAEGNPSWEVIMEGTRLWSVIEADNGDAVSCGGVAGGGFSAMRCDSDGELVWERNYENGRPTAIIELKEGGFIISGILYLPNNERSGYVIKIDGEGNTDWTRRYNMGIAINGMRETDGGIILVGATETSVWLMKIEFEGDVIWSRSYLPPNGVSGYATSVISTDNGFAAGGINYFNNGIGGFSINQFDGDGNVIQNILVNNRSYCENINKLSDGGFIMVGNEGQNPEYPLAIRVDPNGNVIWTNQFEEIVDDQQGNQPHHNKFKSVIVLPRDIIVAAGIMYNGVDGRSHDAVVCRLEPDILGPQVLYFSPEDTVFSTLIGEHIDFIVRARTREGNELRYQWGINDHELGNDTLQAVDFDSIGVYDIFCHLSDDDAEIRLTWHVTVTDLYISAFTPDTLDLTLRRGSSIDFSIDTVRYTDGAEPEYLWTVTNLDNPGEPEFGGSETAATITFNQSGSYSVEGLAYRGESSDAVTWNVTVRGAIWAFAPEELSFEVLSDSLVQFDVLPTVPDAEGQTIRWLVDGEVVAEDTTGFTWRADFNPPYLAIVQVVVADTVEADTVSWEVTVRQPDGIQDGQDVHPTRYDMLSVSPNPFNSTLTIRYVTGSAARPRIRSGAGSTRLAVYDLSGREVAELPTVSSPQLTGQGKAVGYGDPTMGVTVWDASSAPAGIYLVRLQTGREIITRKVALVR